MCVRGRVDPLSLHTKQVYVRAQVFVFFFVQ